MALIEMSMAFTGLVVSEDEVLVTGWVFIGILSFFLLVNLLNLVYTLLEKKILKRFYLHRNRK